MLWLRAKRSAMSGHRRHSGIHGACSQALLRQWICIYESIARDSSIGADLAVLVNYSRKDTKNEFSYKFIIVMAKERYNLHM